MSATNDVCGLLLAGAFAVHTEAAIELDLLERATEPTEPTLPHCTDLVVLGEPQLCSMVRVLTSTSSILLAVLGLML